MLAQVTDIPKFIMADSEDEFMPIFIAASAAFVANNPKHLPAGRRPAGNIKYICYRRPTSCGHRLDARRSAVATIFGTRITDARPMPHDVPRWPADAKSAGRLSEFPALV